MNVIGKVLEGFDTPDRVAKLYGVISEAYSDKTQATLVTMALIAINKVLVTITKEGKAVSYMLLYSDADAQLMVDAKLATAVAKADEPAVYENGKPEGYTWIEVKA